MNDTNIRYDAYGNKMQDKLGTNMKQTEEKPTNKRNDSYVCSCYWCQRSVSSYYYIIDKKTIPFNHKCPVPTGIIQAYGVVCIDKKIKSKIVVKELKKKGIDTRPFFVPMHKQPVLKKRGYFINSSYPISEFISNNGFYLPTGLTLKGSEINWGNSE